MFTPPKTTAASTPLIEILETRIAPATLNLVGSLLTYSGGSGINNVLTLDISGASYTLADTAEVITLNAAAINAGFSGSGTNNITGPVSAVNSISIVLGDGTDVFNLNGLVDNLSMVNGAGADTVTVATGTLPVGSSVSLSAETVTLNSLNGVTGLTISADTLAVNNSIGFSGDLTIQTLTAGRPIALGSETAGSLSLTTTELNNLIHSGTTQIGNTNSGAINISQNIVGIAGTLSLKSGGGITNTASAGIQVGALAIEAGASVSLTGSNDVGQIAASLTGVGSAFVYLENTDFQVATVDGISGISAGTGANADVTLSGGLAVTQAPGAPIVANGLRLITGGPYTLTDSGNDVAILSASTLKAITYTDATGFDIGTVSGSPGVFTANSNIILVALGGDIRVLNADGSSFNDLDAGTGRIQLTAGAVGSDFAIDIQANAGVKGGGPNGVKLRADHITVSARVTSSTFVELQTFEASTGVALGGVDSAQNLGLTDAELDLIFSPEISIFSSSGPFTLSAAITPAQATTLSLSGASFTGAGSVTVAEWFISTQGLVFLPGANDTDLLNLIVVGNSPEPITINDADGFTLGDTSTFLNVTGFRPVSFGAGSATVAFSSMQNIIVAIGGTVVGTSLSQISVQGVVTLGGGILQPQAVGSLAQGTEFVILANDGSDAITGIFKDLPEGTRIPNFQPPAFITYTGGDGNDVAIKTLPPLAVTLSNAGKTATFRDVDGDLVTVKTNKGAFTGSEFAGFVSGANDEGQLQTLTLGTAFTGANITFTAKPSATGGNGFVNVGFVDATGVDLGTLSIAGDLGRIKAGTVGGNAKVPALKSLTVQSMGVLDVSTQNATLPNLLSIIEGTLAKLNVKSDLRRTGLIIQGTDGFLGSATIGGSVIGDGDQSAFLSAKAGIGSVRVNGDIRHRSGVSFSTTSIVTDGAIGSIIVKGAIESEFPSGIQISAFGQLTAPSKGVDFALKSLTVGGSVVNLRLTLGAGAAKNADASLGTVTVGGDWITSSIAAGTDFGADARQGTADDAKVSGVGTRDNPAILSSIGSFTVKGQAFGSASVGDMFGVVAEKIGKAKVGVRSFAFIADKGATLNREAFFASPNVSGSGTENPMFDFAIREIGSTTPTIALGGPNLVISTDGKTATFTDVDGDLVTVKRSLGTFAPGDFTIPTAASGGGLLEALTITPEPNGLPVNLSITAKVGPGGGNGFVNVGEINADTTDLGLVVIGGELQDLDTGDNNGAKVGLASLTVHSLGAIGRTAPSGDEINSAHGIGKIVVKTDIRNFHIFANNSDTGNLGSLTVGGSMITSEVQTAANIGTVKLGGSYRGNSRFQATERIGSITVGGDFAGEGNSFATIEAFAQDTGPLKGPDIALKSLTVGGSVDRLNIILGRNNNADASIGTITVGREWAASSVRAGTDTGTDTFTGTVDDQKVTLGGPTDLARFSTIASILIKGQAIGSTKAGDSFGIVAEQILKAKIGTRTFVFDKGERDAADAFAAAPTGSGATGLASDFFLREVTT